MQYPVLRTVQSALHFTYWVNKHFRFPDRPVHSDTISAFRVMSLLIAQSKSNASSYIAQYPVLRTVQSALHFTSLTDLFTQSPSRLLWEASSHMLQLMREGCSHTYPPLSIARYSFIQLSELEQCRVKKLAQGFNTAARIRTRVLVVESPKLYP